jgi:Rps23 Pro-64 3,4-dihydroxylase Tpa1-like proline 4-hydroxylase
MAKNNDALFVDPALLQQAEVRCKQRLENEPENRAALRSLAEVYRKLGNLPAAADLYDRLFRLDPADHEAGYLQAVLGGSDCPQPPIGIRAAPFVLLKDFLAREFHDALVPFMVSVRDKFVPMVGGNKEYQPNHRQALDFPDKWEGKQRFRSCLAKILPQAIPRLHLPEFVIGPIEVCVRAYQDGNFFRVHQDSSPTGPCASRVINFVYYFHKLPRSYTGGELLLFDSDIEADTFSMARFTRVVPEDNSLIIFPCNFYHSVVPIRCPSQDFADSRFVINGHVHERIEAAAGVVGAGEQQEDAETSN